MTFLVKKQKKAKARKSYLFFKTGVNDGQKLVDNDFFGKKTKKSKSKKKLFIF